MKKIDLREKVLTANDKIARKNREMFSETGTLVLNLVSSPGSGKTALIEETVKALKGEYKIFVITGDLMTENDARRVARHGVDAVQISTGDACHLNARMVDARLTDKGTLYDLVIVENVGNLVCPAPYDLGEDFKVLLVAVGEGDDKPVKYPPMVRASEVLVITKTDLVPYTDSDPARIKANALKIRPDLKVFQVSVKTPEGLDEWTSWLSSRLKAKKQMVQGK
jgi:hydrogenase nickel incorporation protein HypB